MKVGSVFSGIGGLDLGLERAGMEVIWQVEIDPYRRQLLEHHWPAVERFEDVRSVRGEPTRRGAGGTTIAEEAIGEDDAVLAPIDLICGGFPCQDLSIAGRRAGLQGSRSGLFFEFARIVGEIRPAWLLVENVPGLLSSNGGDDFRIVIDTLQGIGYGVSWRVLDSRYFGVPQRRRRVYIVGSLGDLRSAAVLFEPESGQGDSQAGKETGQGVAYSLTGSPRGTGDGHGNAWNTTYLPVSHALTAPTPGSTGRFDPNGETYVLGAPADPDRMREATGDAGRVDVPVLGDVAEPLRKAYGTHGNSHDSNLVAASLRSRQSNEGVNPPGRGGEDDANLVAAGDPVDAKPCCPDGPRYAALGDAVTVNVAEWIGRRIMMVEAS